MDMDEITEKNRGRIARMEVLLKEALAPSFLEIIDESCHHVGHAGAKGGAGHFKLTIRSDKFNDLGLVAQHRLIYKTLDEMFPTEIHALSIDAQRDNKG